MKLEVAIAGAGISGLCSALALASQGHEISLYEQSEQLEEIGAGLQLSPNATRILEKLGVADALALHWLEPKGLELLSGRSLRRLTHVELGAAALKRWEAPYAVVHRGALQTVLFDKCSRARNISFHFGQRLDCAGLAALASSGDMLIGADGVWSTVRETFENAGIPRFARHIAWRATATFNDVRDLVSNDSVNVFLGPRSHLVVYRIGPTLVNLVAVTPGKQTAKDWNLAGESTQLRKSFTGWHDAVHAAIAGTSWRCWPIYEVGNGSWQDGLRTVLVGDAAHAMPPHAAQGAAMAIEDAFELSICIKRHDSNVTSAIAAFEARRKTRLSRIRRRGWLNRFAYQAIGPIRIGRDILFALRSPERFASDLDWIFGYDASTGAD
jgi:salicylate hydroxylase